MEKMTAAMMKETAKRNVLALLAETLEANGAERYGSDFEVAIPTEVNGQEIWVGVVLTAKQYTATKVSDPFDPFALRAEYDEEQRIKAAEKAEKDKAKAEAKARREAKSKSRSKE